MARELRLSIRVVKRTEVDGVTYAVDIGGRKWKWNPRIGYWQATRAIPKVTKPVGHVDTCTLCERPRGELRGHCAYEGSRGCKTVQGRLQLAAIRKQKGGV